MSDAYETALRIIADAYEAEYGRWGGKSLSRVATIVASSGAFFIRLRDGKSFSVTNLEKFAAWFRQSANWPDAVIPHDAVQALVSIGRPPLNDAAPYRIDAAQVRSNDAPAFDRERGA